MQRIAGLALLVPVVTFAAAPAGNDVIEIEEIVVTAQKREEALQDVPFSVAAATDTQIRNSGADNVVDLARNFAGLTIADLGPGQSQIAIRGISAGQVIRDQPGVKEQVGVYLDESPISIALFTPDLELFDLERFEVLRGPQGTLFGAGSLSGTLRYITAAPRLNEYEGNVELTALDGTGTDVGGKVRGAVNIPLGERAAVRIAGYRSELPGFIDAVQSNGSVREDVDSGDKTGGRIALLFQPTENVTILPRVVYQELDTDGFPRIDVFNFLANSFTTTEPAVNLGNRQQFTQVEEGLEDDFALVDLKLEINLGPVTLTSVSSYTDREVVVTRDSTALSSSVVFSPFSMIPGFFPNLPNPTPATISALVRTPTTLTDTTDLEALSQEVRLTSNSEGKFQWLVGAFYQDVERDYGQANVNPGFDATTGIDNSQINSRTDATFFSSLVYDFEQFALFAEGTYAVTDKLGLTLGVRYYDFDEDRLLNFGGIFTGATVDSAGSTSSDGVSPRFILAYNPTEDVQLTAQVSRGFRLGGINDPVNIPACSNPADGVIFGNQPDFDDETVINYELGAKTQFADRRLTVNVAAFYSDIEDLQGTADARSCNSRIVFNVADARSVGIEAELFARVGANWDFGLAVTAVDAELRSSVTGLDANNNPFVISGLAKGARLPTAPKFQAVGSAGYRRTLGSSGISGFANFTVQFVGSSFSQFTDQSQNAGVLAGPGVNIPGAAPLFQFGNPSISTFGIDPKLDEYTIGNLRFGIQKNLWEAAVIVNNVWDERAQLALDRERGASARVGFITNTPRTYGITVSRSF
jgi:iron complex outermembrane receptor protein